MKYYQNLAIFYALLIILFFQQSAQASSAASVEPKHVQSSSTTTVEHKHSLLPSAIDEASLYLSTDQNQLTKVIAEKIISGNNTTDIHNLYVEVHEKNHCILSAKSSFGIVDYKKEKVSLKGPVELVFSTSDYNTLQQDENCHNIAMNIGPNLYQGILQNTDFNYKVGTVISAEPVIFKSSNMLLNANGMKLNTITQEIEFNRGVMIELIPNPS